VTKSENGIATHQIRTVSQFLNKIEELKEAEEKRGNKADFIFRGQPCDKSLRPKLARRVTKGSRLKIEKLIFNEFKRTSFALTDLQPQSDWDFLSLAQHFGLPTRFARLDIHCISRTMVCCRKRTPKG
jgi:hypothetical protein